MSRSATVRPIRMQVFYGLLSSGKAFDPTVLVVLRTVVFFGLVVNITSAMLQRNRNAVREPVVVALGLGKAADFSGASSVDGGKME